jgi:hypothetical protein
MDRRKFLASAALAPAALTVLSPGAQAQPAESPAKGEWIQLFNGKDLTGWTPKIKGF